MPVARVTLIKSMGFIFLMMLAGAAVAAETCQTTVGHLVTAEGQVDVQRTGSSGWREGLLGGVLCQGDTVRAGASSRATIRLINQAVLRIDQNTAMRLDNISGVSEERSSLSLLKGAFQSFSRKPRGFEVSTPYLNGSIEGTEFVFRVKENSSELTVLEGLVLASNEYGSVEVGGGESALSRKGKAPSKRTVVKPRDAVQWSLYYPPLKASSSDKAAASSLQQAASLLSVGRVDEAQAKIDTALKRNPNAGEGYALRAVINVAQNNSDQAMADARQAVALSPESSSAKIALSYAQQSTFDLQGARDTLQQAVQQQPNDALAWARLAELQLMLGDRKQSGVSAQKAVSLQPDLGRTQMTLGFAALAEFRNDEARAAFERAIEYDSADPLAHLGLGLARISSGNLQAGRADIEVAVGLGSNDALLRAYLGKAYFEEKRSPLDSDQFAVAKQLDPNDPTAYLYEGIAKQTQNRPIEAMRDLELSLELNDNRAVYRSRLLLDKDRAARGTSLARAYNDLGFRQLGLNQSTQSLVIDPANASAHRFLSDTYRTGSRTENARVSELLQAQMLQDININPIQPSNSSTNLNIVTMGGPASAGFNEFTPLFERNKVKFDVTGAVGNNGTRTGEAVVSGLYDRFSLSGGSYYYDTDGFRENNGLKHEIYNLFGQVAITPEVNVQVEFGKRNTDRGDLAMKFDPNDFDPTFRRSLDANSARIGARISPALGSDILLSVISTNRDIDGTQKTELFAIPGLGAFNLRADVESEDDTLQYDAQYIYTAPNYNLVVGGAYTDVDRMDALNLIFETPFGNDPPINIMSDFDTKDGRIYGYANIGMPENLIWTVGASYADFVDGEAFDYDEFSPKLGVRWSITDELQLRGAYFEGVKPVLSANRTLEPTQVAGFNQYFDDANGTKFKRYGVGLDWKVSQDISVGAELTMRDLDWPTIEAETGQGNFEERNEDMHRAYAYWIPSDRWALNAELVYDKFENQNGSNLASDVPKQVKTFSLPLRVNYFHPSGLFVGVGATYVDQEVEGDADYSHATGDSSFALVDLAIGYRLPKRYGIVSLVVQNLFDKEFDYLDNSYRVSQDEPMIGPYLPEISIVGRVTLNF